MSFYRKYRPQTFSALVGQDHVRQTFLNALARGSLAHAYLFAGPRGTGKTSTARIIARAINCENPRENGEPCNECPVCADALAGRLVDLIEIDAASNRGIDEMRDLKEKIQFTPSRARAKIYIIDEVHMLTKEAFNALLKTLEEPPAHAYFILATTEAHKVPETIISRCQRFDFHRISIPDLVGHLQNIARQENIEADEKALELIARQSAGGHRDALGLLEQIGSNGKITLESIANVLGLTRPQTVESFVFALLFARLAEALATIDGLVADGVNLIQFNKSVVMRLRELMLERVAENKFPEAQQLLALIEVFTRAGEALKNTIIPQLPLEIAVIEICGTKGERHEAGGEGREAMDEGRGSRENPKSEIPNSKFQIPEKSEISNPKPDSEIPTTNNQQPTTSSGSETSEKSEISNPKPDLEIQNPAIPRRRDTSKIQNPTIFSVDVQKAFPEIVNKVAKSATKLALKECSVLRVENERVIFGVPNNFLLEKLNVPTIKNELADILAELLDAKLAVSFELSEIQIAPVVPEVLQSEVPTPVKPDLATAAEELFDE